MAKEYELVAGDTASALQVTCMKKSTGQLLDDVAAIKVHWLDADGVLVERDMNLVSPSVGEYVFDAGEIFAPRMRFDFEAIDSGGRSVTSLTELEVNVRIPLSQVTTS